MEYPYSVELAKLQGYRIQQRQSRLVEACVNDSVVLTLPELLSDLRAYAQKLRDFVASRRSKEQQ